MSEMLEMFKDKVREMFYENNKIKTIIYLIGTREREDFQGMLNNFIQKNFRFSLESNQEILQINSWYSGGNSVLKISVQSGLNKKITDYNAEGIISLLIEKLQVDFNIDDYTIFLCDSCIRLRDENIKLKEQVEILDKAEKINSDKIYHIENHIDKLSNSYKHISDTSKSYILDENKPESDKSIFQKKVEVFIDSYKQGNYDAVTTISRIVDLLDKGI